MTSKTRVPMTRRRRRSVLAIPLLGAQLVIGIAGAETDRSVPETSSVPSSSTTIPGPVTTETTTTTEPSVTTGVEVTSTTADTDASTSTTKPTPKPPKSTTTRPTASTSKSTPPKTEDGPTSSVPKASRPTPIAEVEGDEPGMGDGKSDLVSLSSVNSSASGNTGGGNVSGDNPLVKVADGKFVSLSVSPTGKTGKTGESTLLSAVETVGVSTQTVAAASKEASVNTQFKLAAAETKMEAAQKKTKTERLGLDDAESEIKKADSLLTKTAAAGYANAFGPNDPKVIPLSDGLQGSPAREYAASAMNVATTGQDTAAAKMVEARKQVVVAETSEKTAKAEVDFAAASVKRADAEAKKLAAQSAALTITTGPATSAANTVAPAVESTLTDLPDEVSVEAAVEDVTPAASPEAEAEAEAATSTLQTKVGDPALNALIAQSGQVTFPIAGKYDFIDSWGYARSGGRQHQGADIFSPRHTPVVAVENGTVTQKDNSLGGVTLYLQGDSGNRYYYAHLQARAAMTADGRVEAGAVLGTVGNSGNAAGTPTHLHFEVKPGGGASVNPYPLLSTVSEAVESARG